jgi:hypothetical protein
MEGIFLKLTVGEWTTGVRRASAGYNQPRAEGEAPRTPRTRTFSPSRLSRPHLHDGPASLKPIPLVSAGESAPYSEHFESDAFHPGDTLEPNIEDVPAARSRGSAICSPVPVDHNLVAGHYEGPLPDHVSAHVEHAYPQLRVDKRSRALRHGNPEPIHKRIWVGTPSSGHTRRGDGCLGRDHKNNG